MSISQGIKHLIALDYGWGGGLNTHLVSLSNIDFLTFLAHLWGAYAIPLALSCVRRLCPPNLPEIIMISNPYLVQMFMMFLDCASLGIGGAPYISHKIVAQKPNF